MEPQMSYPRLYPSQTQLHHCNSKGGLSQQARRRSSLTVPLQQNSASHWPEHVSHAKVTTSAVFMPLLSEGMIITEGKAAIHDSKVPSLEDNTIAQCEANSQNKLFIDYLDAQAKPINKSPCQKEVEQHMKVVLHEETKPQPCFQCCVLQ